MHQLMVPMGTYHGEVFAPVVAYVPEGPDEDKRAARVVSLVMWLARAQFQQLDEEEE